VYEAAGPQVRGRHAAQKRGAPEQGQEISGVLHAPDQENFDQAYAKYRQ
jgi:hypothetical protein